MADIAVYCTQCGNALTADDRFCSKCGTQTAPAEESAEEPVEAQESSSGCNKGCAWIVGAIAVLLIVGFVGGQFADEVEYRITVEINGGMFYYLSDGHTGCSQPKYEVVVSGGSGWGNKSNRHTLTGGRQSGSGYCLYVVTGSVARSDKLTLEIPTHRGEINISSKEVAVPSSSGRVDATVRWASYQSGP